MATTAASGSLSAADHSTELRKAVIAATVGTTIEWYDFFIYGTAAGLVFGKLSFPNSDPLTATLVAFSTYFIGFIGRPIGAAIFGHYGDRIGRKATLIATLLLMGIATFLIAFVPSYDSIGIWGAIILTVLRALQGIGVGGEWGGSVLISMEWSRGHHNRGLVASWPQFGVPCGLFLSNLVMLGASSWSGDQFLTWGWRIPFFLSIVLVAIGLWIRLGILETPVFQKLLSQKKIEHAPIIEVFKKQPSRSCSRPSCGCPNRRRSTSSPPSSSPMASARCTCRGTSSCPRCWSRPACRSSRSRFRATSPTGSAGRRCT